MGTGLAGGDGTVTAGSPVPVSTTVLDGGTVVVTTGASEVCGASDEVVAEIVEVLEVVVDSVSSPPPQPASSGPMAMTVAAAATLESTLR